MLEYNADCTLLSNSGKHIYDFLSKSAIKYIKECIRRRDNENKYKYLEDRIKLLEDYIKESIEWSPDGKYSKFDNLQGEFITKYDIYHKKESES